LELFNYTLQRNEMMQQRATMTKNKHENKIDGEER
jgi:hypothetical protein